MMMIIIIIMITTIRIIRIIIITRLIKIIIVIIRKPHIVVLDKTKNTRLIVDVAIPGDHRIALKEVEKIMNYAELKV